MLLKYSNDIDSAGSLKVEYELIVKADSKGYNAEIVNALTELSKNSSIKINNQTAEAKGMSIGGNECELLMLKLIMYTKVLTLIFLFLVCFLY